MVFCRNLIKIRFYSNTQIWVKIMSSKEERLKKKLQEDRQKQEALGREIEQVRLEEEKRKAAALLDESSPKSQPSEELTRYNIQSSGVESEDWKKIIEDYKKKYPENPIEKNTLTFPTKKDAIDFFTAQATTEPPRKFLASEIDQNGKPTGFNLFSCGDGKLYKGTFNEIQDQLKAAQKENPDDPNLKQGLATIARFVNPAQGFRETLLQTKEPEKTASTEEHQSGSSLANPLSTKPKTL